MQLQSTIPTSPPSFDITKSGLSNINSLGKSSTRNWEDLNQYEENIPVEEDTSGPMADSNLLDFGNWDSMNRTTFEDVCDRGGSSE